MTPSRDCGKSLRIRSSRPAFCGRLTSPVSTCPRLCLFQSRKNPVFVVASFFEVSFPFGFVAGFFWCRLGAGAGSFFRLCCWLWMPVAWAWVLTLRSSGRLPAAAYLDSLAPKKTNLFRPCLFKRHSISQALFSAGFVVCLGFAYWHCVIFQPFWLLALS